MSESVSQSNIKKQLALFLEPNNLELANELKKHGYCFGFAVCDAVMHNLGKATWWLELKKAIANWDGDREKLKTIHHLPGCEEDQTLEKLFFRMISYIVINHAALINYPFLPKQNKQSNFLKPAVFPPLSTDAEERKCQILNRAELKGFELSIQDEKTQKNVVKTIKSHDGVGGYFEPATLETLLLQNKEIIAKSICMIGNCTHGAALCADDTHWYFYENNDEDGKPHIFTHTQTKDLVKLLHDTLTESISIECASFDTEIKLNIQNVTCDHLDDKKDEQEKIKRYSERLKGCGLHLMAQLSSQELVPIFQSRHADVITQIANGLQQQSNSGGTGLHVLAGYASAFISELINLADEEHDDIQINKAIMHLRTSFGEALAIENKDEVTGLQAIITSAPDSLPLVLKLAKKDKTIKDNLFFVLALKKANGSDCAFGQLMHLIPNQIPELIDLANDDTFLQIKLTIALEIENDYQSSMFMLLAGLVPERGLLKLLELAEKSSVCRDMIFDKLFSVSKDKKSALYYILVKSSQLLPRLFSLLEKEPGFIDTLANALCAIDNNQWTLLHHIIHKAPTQLLLLFKWIQHKNFRERLLQALSAKADYYLKTGYDFLGKYSPDYVELFHLLKIYFVYNTFPTTTEKLNFVADNLSLKKTPEQIAGLIALALTIDYEEITQENSLQSLFYTIHSQPVSDLMAKLLEKAKNCITALSPNPLHDENASVTRLRQYCQIEKKQTYLQILVTYPENHHNFRTILQKAKQDKVIRADLAQALVMKCEKHSGLTTIVTYAPKLISDLIELAEYDNAIKLSLIQEIFSAPAEFASIAEHAPKALFECIEVAKSNTNFMQHLSKALLAEDTQKWAGLFAAIRYAPQIMPLIIKLAKTNPILRDALALALVNKDHNKCNGLHTLICYAGATFILLLHFAKSDLIIRDSLINALPESVPEGYPALKQMIELAKIDHKFKTSLIKAMLVVNELGQIGVNVIARKSPADLSCIIDFAKEDPEICVVLFQSLAIQDRTKYTALDHIMMKKPELMPLILGLAKQYQETQVELAKALALQDENNWTGLHTFIRYVPACLDRLYELLKQKTLQIMVARALAAQNNQNRTGYDFLQQYAKPWVPMFEIMKYENGDSKSIQQAIQAVENALASAIFPQQIRQIIHIAAKLTPFMAKSNRLKTPLGQYKWEGAFISFALVKLIQKAKQQIINLMKKNNPHDEQDILFLKQPTHFFEKNWMKSYRQLAPEENLTANTQYRRITC